TRIFACASGLNRGPTHRRLTRKRKDVTNHAKTIRLQSLLGVGAVTGGTFSAREIFPIRLSLTAQVELLPDASRQRFLTGGQEVGLSQRLFGLAEPAGVGISRFQHA